MGKPQIPAGELGTGQVSGSGEAVGVLRAGLGAEFEGWVGVRLVSGVEHEGESAAGEDLESEVAPAFGQGPLPSRRGVASAKRV
jgi:hypothetical protein